VVREILTLHGGGFHETSEPQRSLHPRFYRLHCIAIRVLLLFKPCIRLDDVCFQVQGLHRHVAAKSRGLRGLFPLALAILGREFTQPGAVRVYRGLLAQQLAHSAAAAGSGKTS